MKSVLSLGALKRLVRKMLDDDCAGLAGQLAYFTLLSLFPLLMSLVAVAGLVMDDPESALRTLTESMQGVLPQEGMGLLVDYIERTLRSATSGVLLFGVLATLWSGSTASYALINAANRAYELRETRPLWKVWGISLLMVFWLALLIAALALVIFSAETEGYLQRLTGLPDFFVSLWSVLRWVVAFVAVTIVHAILYYTAPSADVPFKWITPGGLTATVLILVSSVALSFYVANFGRYDQLYGPIGAVIVLMLWLYVGSFMVLLGVEMNAVLARMAEEQEQTEIIQSEGRADKPNL
ncbi:MAG TPA: YihY/virulence factor BrkB family protein [Rubrobacteraceae bacterium]|nr:YihY/virulence factor BrkB family protein [Rubrobacteraceae bacterium]